MKKKLCARFLTRIFSLFMNYGSSENNFAIVNIETAIFRLADSERWNQPTPSNTKSRDRRVG